MRRTRFLKVDQDHPDDEVVGRATKVLSKGGIVCFPTETVYGLGVRISDNSALEELFLIKGRKKGSAFSIFVRSAEEATNFTREVNSSAKRLMDGFWPGPLTLVCKSKVKNLSPYLLSRNKIGIRVSSSPLVRKLVDKLGEPITATSANLSGEKPCLSFQQVRRVFRGKVDLILDGGRTQSDNVSTVLDVSGEKVVLVREGVVPLIEIRRAIPELYESRKNI